MRGMSPAAKPMTRKRPSQARLRTAGYHVHTQTIPTEITPKNRLLLAGPLPHRDGIGDDITVSALVQELDER